VKEGEESEAQEVKCPSQGHTMLSSDLWGPRGYSVLLHPKSATQSHHFINVIFNDLCVCGPGV
jgi:hypothetical protein